MCFVCFVRGEIRPCKGLVLVLVLLDNTHAHFIELDVVLSTLASLAWESSYMHGCPGSLLCPTSLGHSAVIDDTLASYKESGLLSSYRSASIRVCLVS